MKYDDMLALADRCGLIAQEKPLWNHDGMIWDRYIAIRESLSTRAEKACVLAEEIGHAATSVGDITDYTNPNAWKQEVKARTVGYDIMIGLDGIVDAYNAGCQNRHEMAEYIGCTERYLEEAIKRYKEIYGICQKYKGYIIYFEPSLAVLKIM